LRSEHLTDEELERLLSFVGYGRGEADVWFLGMEEAGGGEDNLRARLQFEPIEDLARAHRILGVTKHHTGQRVIQPTWRGMCYIMLALEGRPTDRESIRRYQTEWLGRFQGNTLLCELMPIPKPRIGDWGYESFIPQFRSAEEYYGVVKPWRVQLLGRLIRKYQPKVVIGYGKGHWDAYQALFPEIDFEREDIFLIGTGQESLAVLTPHLTAREMNRRLGAVVLLIHRYLGETIVG